MAAICLSFGALCAVSTTTSSPLFLSGLPGLADAAGLGAVWAAAAVSSCLAIVWLPSFCLMAGLSFAGLSPESLASFLAGLAPSLAVTISTSRAKGEAASALLASALACEAGMFAGELVRDVAEARTQVFR